MKKIAMMVVAVLLSAGMFANSANLPVKPKKVHGTTKTVTKKQADKKEKKHERKSKHAHKANDAKK
jgi:hypothetical protein